MRIKTVNEILSKEIAVSGAVIFKGNVTLFTGLRRKRQTRTHKSTHNTS